MNNIRHYKIYLFLIEALSHVRPLGLAYRLAARLADRFSPRQGEMALVAHRLTACAPSNLTGEPSQQEQSYRQNIGVATLNTYLFRSMSPAWLGRNIEIVGGEHLHAALAAGRGVMVLTGHQHHLVFLGVALGLMGLRLNPILLDPKLTVPDFLEKYMGRMIGDSQAHYHGGRYALVDFTGQFLRRLYRTLQAGDVVVSASDFPNDLAPKRRFQFPFLNQTISIPYGSMKVAADCGARIVTAFISWQGGSRFVLTFKPITDNSVKEICATYTRHLEAAVRADPGGWEGWKWGALFRPDEDA